MKVNGTLMNYYFHCKRQCYLFGNRLNLEDNSEEVKIGKAIHEEKADKSNTEIAIDNIRLDKLTGEYLTEVKKSDADVEASKWQLLYYLKVLEEKGIIRKGKLEFAEKNKGTKKVMDFELTEETEQELEGYVQEIDRLLEGEVWMRFYSNFKYFLPEDFVMNKRVKRPPDNPMNAMVSFGNTLLYTKTISAIYRTHLDQRISFLHEPSEGRFSLSLDMSEVFKPVIVYRTIFDLVNNRKIQVAKHFEKKVNYCLLNEEGRKVFIEAFEGRMESVFQHPVLKRKVTYRTALKLDCYKLIKEIMEDKEFAPFSLKGGF